MDNQIGRLLLAGLFGLWFGAAMHTIGKNEGLKEGEIIGREKARVVMQEENGKMQQLIKDSCQKADYRFLCEINKKEMGEP